MEKTPQQIVEEILATANEDAMQAVRNRLQLQKEMLVKMEDGTMPLPSPKVRPLLFSELQKQITDCATYETLAKTEEVRSLVNECGTWAAEALQRFHKLFDKETGTVTAAN
jgi:hypothetical protein